MCSDLYRYLVNHYVINEINSIRTNDEGMCHPKNNEMVCEHEIYVNGDEVLHLIYLKQTHHLYQKLHLLQVKANELKT